MNTLDSTYITNERIQENSALHTTLNFSFSLTTRAHSIYMYIPWEDPKAGAVILFFVAQTRVLLISSPSCIHMCKEDSPPRLVKETGVTNSKHAKERSSRGGYDDEMDGDGRSTTQCFFFFLFLCAASDRIRRELI